MAQQFGFTLIHLVDTTKVPYFRSLTDSVADYDAAVAWVEANAASLCSDYTVGDGIYIWTTDTVEAELQGIATDDGLGQSADAIVAAGAVGSVSAKLRRLTNDLDALFDLLPAALSNGFFKVSMQEQPVAGTEANAWSAESTGAGGFSDSVDCRYEKNISAFGNVDGATTLTLQVSQNNTDFYDTDVDVTTGGADDFHLFLETGARYVRLKSSADVTATASIVAK